MIKIHYPEDLEKLKTDYLKLFDLPKMRRRWLPVEKIHRWKIEDILVGDFSSLVDVYFYFKSQVLTKRQIDIYKDIFDYETMQPVIAKFFMDKKNKIEFSTCHYCNMAYINSFSKDLAYIDKMDFINNAYEDELREIFGEDVLPSDKLNQLLTNRPFDNESAFNRQGILNRRLETYKRLDLSRSRNHFDIDHLLPKGICPIVGLSLFNFVPACQVCNEKLKKMKELAQSKEDWLKISPTHGGSTFDEDVTIKLMQEHSCSTFFEQQKNRDNFYLKFDTNGNQAFDKYISTFHLADRYNYHKDLALHILDLKERYSPEKRKEISRLLSADGTKEACVRYSEAQIEADILQEKFHKDRCFAKLRRDLIHRN